MLWLGNFFVTEHLEVLQPEGLENVDLIVSTVHLKSIF
jgi:hypothetical protein